MMLGKKKGRGLNTSGAGFFIYIILFVFVASLVIAHGDVEDEHEETKTIDAYVNDLSLKVVYIGAALIVLLVIVSIMFEQSHKHKMLLFLGIAIPSIFVTVFLSVSTIYLNVLSETKGPVHWHADYEIYKCGQEIDIVNPEGISNRVGSSSFHEHGDNRIHIEGVIVDSSDVRLERFIEVIGGKMTMASLTLPTNTGTIVMNNGELCNGKPAMVQVFVYQTQDGKVHQKKLDNYLQHVAAPYPNVPPGDCIIIEFDQEKQSTEHICKTYQIALQKGEISGS